MGHWQNSRTFKEPTRLRDRLIAAGRQPITLGLMRGTAPLRPATLCSILNHLAHRRLVVEILAASPTVNWAGLHDWCWVMDVRLGYRAPRQLIREPGICLVSFDAPDDWIAEARRRGRKVWQPMGPSLSYDEWQAEIAPQACVNRV